MDMMLLRVLGMTEMRGVVISQKNTRLTTKRHGFNAGAYVETPYDVMSLPKVG